MNFVHQNETREGLLPAKAAAYHFPSLVVLATESPETTVERHPICSAAPYLFNSQRFR